MSLFLQAAAGMTETDVRALLRGNAEGLIFGVILFAVGAVALALCFSRRGKVDLSLLAFGGFSALYGLRLLAGQRTTALVTGLSEQTLRALSSYISYVILVPAFGFWERMLGPGWKSTLRVVVWLAAGFAAIAVLLEGVPGAHGGLMAVNNLLVILGLGIAMLNLFVFPPAGVPGMGALRLGSVVMGVFALGENLAGLGFRIWPAGHEVIGFFFFICCLGYAAAMRVATNEKKLVAIEAELEMARRIQSSILPRQTPKIPGLDVAVRYLPAASVAGDFYDFLPVDGQRVTILEADVSGHGVPAALIASMIKVAFSSQAEHAEDPALIMTRMGHAFFEQSPETFITAGCLFLDLPGRRMRYAGAGHPPLLLWRGKEGNLRAFRENGIIIGPIRGTVYTNQELDLMAGDRLVLYTDGITEAENRAGDLFGEERLLNFIAEHAVLPASVFADALLVEIAKWSGKAPGAPLRDDVTLIVADILG